MPTIVYTFKNYEIFQGTAKYYQYFTIKILEFFLEPIVRKNWNNDHEIPGHGQLKYASKPS